MNPFLKKNYRVLIRSCTYNQSKYIEQALDGFASQKTNFPFSCLVIDDCSTDGEQGVIDRWMERNCNVLLQEQFEIPEAKIVVVPHKENMQCFFAFYFLKKNLYREQEKKQKLYEPWQDSCEYIALCEGDDYWTDANKLQKQVSFLDENNDYSMCFHAAKIEREKDHLKTSILCECVEDRDYSATELFENWIVPTASVCFKKDVACEPIKHKERILNSDIFLVETAAHLGRVRGFAKKMSVYRVQDTGVTYDKSLLIKRKLAYPAHFKTIAENFPCIKNKIVRKKIIYSYIEIYKCFGKNPMWIIKAFLTSPLLFLELFFKKIIDIRN